ncbi:DUF3180 domain-containing protein [Nocardiopsis sp. NPDC049922]|uniref:DUF3180 domain-containing protein n=1 Tax=Nocardiopsis sp. NPDC049922 TaxID=3155157 RepID=UPI0033EBB39F
MTEEREGRIRPTGWRVPVLLMVVGALLGWLITGSIDVLPPLPWSAIPTLLLLAFAEAFTARRTRRRIRRAPGTEPIQPLSAARLVALAKASALFAALAAGFFLGMALAVVDTLVLPSHREVFVTALGTAGASGLLLGAALWLESACRVPEDGEGEDGPSGRA